MPSLTPFANFPNFILAIFFCQRSLAFQLYFSSLKSRLCLLVCYCKFKTNSLKSSRRIASMCVCVCKIITDSTCLSFCANATDFNICQRWLVFKCILVFCSLSNELMMNGKRNKKTIHGTIHESCCCCC